MSNRLLLKGGTVIDGTRRGLPRKRDVLIEGERIESVALRIRAAGARVLDAHGLTVTPGFIDAHAHSDVTAFLAPSAQGRVFDGVTTEVSGTCGLSFFPLIGPAARQRVRSLRRQGVEPDWRDAAGFFDSLQARGSAINRVFFVGHGALRAAVMGYEARPAKPAEVRRMATLLDEALEQGAFGLSTGLCYAPGCFAEASELKELCRRLARTGRPHASHIRNEGHRLMTALREVIGFSRASGGALQLSHVKTFGHANWWKIDALERALFEARKNGTDLAADRYPYIAAHTDLSAVFPKWLLAGGKGAALRRLKHKATRAKLRREVLGARANKVRWDRIQIASTAGRAEEFEGMTVSQVAQEMGLEPCDAAFRLLIRTGMASSAIFFVMSERNLERILKWPFVFVGSDSSARATAGPTAHGKPHPRTFGTFCRFLSEYVLRRKILELPEAIARITSLPAKCFGFKGRGVLKPGAYADVCAFDAERIRDKATFDKPFQLSEGVRHLIINGVPVLRNRRQTSARPGRVLRA